MILGELLLSIGLRFSLNIFKFLDIGLYNYTLAIHRLYNLLCSLYLQKNESIWWKMSKYLNFMSWLGYESIFDFLIYKIL